ncbi:MBL fold metallo-hydrolase RNA specificity domain-containing protein [Desulfatibacillum aliphaticivorans]|uniref:MBL fold metallo-hydrolase RNA specificity domain-containing protein n=1 Tax=Desulfatibacillum aliphaticivorans TaxID=218208 RepID=UPI0004870034|nr:MBL fold metallo-hydrolase [Desulfatibacillum aliphaticivorans]
MVRVTCLGAAGGVTGSNHLVETSDGRKILVDCGLFQGGKQMEARNWESWGFNPADIDLVIVTHAHIDHIGRIPKLIKDGYKGKIIASPPTIDLAEILLLDSAHIQEMNAEWQTRKNKRRGSKDIQPLYTTPDAERSLSHFQPQNRDEMLELNMGVKIRLRNAGHILGSAILEMWIEDDGQEMKIVFSGDIGQPEQLIIKDPYEVFAADFLFMESTYGNRLHKSHEESRQELLEAIKYSYENGEKVVIPAFAVERTQEILYILGEFHRAGVLPDMPIYLDSPLAIKATEIFRKHKKHYDEEAMAIVQKGFDPLDLPNLKFTPSTAESIAINERPGPAIVMAGNGMCTAGRIKHHLKHNLWRPGSSLVIVGFQAQGTTGRRIVEGASEVKIFRETVAVKAKVHTIGGFSAHADQEDLLRWVGHFAESKPKVFPIHGEPEACKVLAEKIQEKYGLETHVPRWRESILLTPKAVDYELPEQEEDMEPDYYAEMNNVIVSMEKNIRELRRTLNERLAKEKDGDHGLERLQFIQEELESILKSG